MRTVHSEADLKRQVDAARAAGREIVFVPTMGALHAGHLSLVDLAKAPADDIVADIAFDQNEQSWFAVAGSLVPFVVVSIFVNPLQFGAGEDFDRYPRTLDADANLLESRGVDVLFAPDVDVVYPNGQEGANHKFAGPVGDILEGASRPGHFDGMLTVVARLFDLVQPDRAVFGAKDAQQVFLVKQLVAAGYPRLKIQTAPTMRESNGLAMSSRNRFLSADEARLATVLNRTLRTANAELEAGAAPSAVLKAHLEQLRADAPQAKLDYLELVSSTDFVPVDDAFKGQAILLIAAKIGQTRLIDNLEVFI